MTEEGRKQQNKIKRVGVIGGGQLAWMMADAAKKLGVDLIIQTSHKDDPAVSIAKDIVLAVTNVVVQLTEYYSNYFVFCHYLGDSQISKFKSQKS